MGSPRSRRGFLAAAGLAALAGCLDRVPRFGAGRKDDPTDESGVGPPVADRSLPGPLGPEALREASRSSDLPTAAVPVLDDPSFVDGGTADAWLADDDVVFGLSRAGVAKAYPQRILVWHEVVNDAVAGEPVAVTYAPLTGTAQAFERGGTTFDVTGRLLDSNLVLVDRETGHWWSQLLATSIPGPAADRLVGRSLRELRLVWTTWGRWRSRFPETAVLSRETGVDRDYADDPYGGYTPPSGYYVDADTRQPRLNVDERFDPKRVVFGVRTPRGAAAVPKDVVRHEVLVSSDIGGTPLLWVYDTRLDSAYAYWNPDRIAFREFMGVIQGAEGNHRADELPLERALTFDAMWFAWSGFYPTTTVYA